MLNIDVSGLSAFTQGVLEIPDDGVMFLYWNDPDRRTANIKGSVVIKDETGTVTATLLDVDWTLPHERYILWGTDDSFPEKEAAEAYGLTVLE